MPCQQLLNNNNVKMDDMAISAKHQTPFRILTAVLKKPLQTSTNLYLALYKCLNTESYIISILSRPI